MTLGGHRALSLAALVLGVAMTLWGIQTLRYAVASKHWPMAGGEISSWRVGQGPDAVSRDYAYHDEARYTYSVNGQQYTGWRVRFGVATGIKPFGSKSQQLEVVYRYPPGTKIKVYYNPADPSVAALQPGADWESTLGLAVGLVIASFGFFRFLSLRHET